MFLFKSPAFLMNELEMSMFYKEMEINGTLYFNMCFDTTLDNLCGKDVSVTGKFIFVVKQPLPGQPDCLVMNPQDQEKWDYSMFKADNESVMLDGVSALNTKFTIEQIGGLEKAIQNGIDNLEEKVLDGLDMLNLKMESKIEKNSIVPQKIQIDSVDSNHKLRILKKSQEEIDAENKEIQRKVTLLNEHMDNIRKARNPEQESPIETSEQSQTINFLKPPVQIKNKAGDDILEESFVMKNFINNKVNSEIQKKFSNSSTPSKKFRLLTKDNEIQEIVKNTVKNVKGAFVEDISAKMNFFCDTNTPKIVSHYLPSQKILEINVFSSDGCVVNFEFLQLLNEIPWITGSVFLILGIGLAFFGIKVYKNMLMVFIPMMITILGFYLYFAFVENKTTSTTKILTLVGLLVFIFMIAILMVWFNWLIYLIVAFGVSCQFGLLAQSLLEQNIEFFTKPYTEWILITVFFVLFTIMYIVAKDYFLIMATAIMGSLFIMLSLKYLGITSYDLLFDTQIDKLSDFKNLDSEVQKMSIVFVALLIIGMVVQIIILRKQHKSEDEERKMQDIHDHGKKNNIQLENI